MATENVKLMQQARASLDSKWGIAIGTFLIYTVITSIASYASIIIAGPFALGLAVFTLNLSRGNEVKIEQLFEGFRRFADGLIAYLLILLYVLLWSLLLIIPGIIKAYSYSMTFFIMNDEPDLTPQEAMAKSQQIMDGYKMKYFRLNIRFFGWALLCILTLGIGFLWLIPYIHVTFAKFYEDIKDNPTTKIEGEYSK